MSYLDDLFNLEDKVAVVTGGLRGNGLSMAKGLLHAGCKVVVADLIVNTDPKLTFTGDKDEKVKQVKCDITSSERDKIFEAAEEFGGLDILVNNAGISLPTTYSSADTSWTKTMAVNLDAAYSLMNRTCDMMARRGTQGSIINITSLNAERAFPNNPAYMASKGGLRQLTKSFAMDYGEYGIRANNVGPGYMRTAMTEGSFLDPEKNVNRENHTMLRRWGNGEDLVGIVLFLASDASSYITGQDIYVDGGWLAKGLIGE